MPCGWTGATPLRLPLGRVTHMFTAASPGDPSAALRTSSTRRSTGAAKPLENPIAADVRFCCKTAVVTTGDNVSAAWRHIYPGSLRDIAFAISKDRGRDLRATHTRQRGRLAPGCVSG